MRYPYFVDKAKTLLYNVYHGHCKMMIIYSNRMLHRPKFNEIYIDVYFWNDAISETFSTILYIKRLKAGYGS